MIIPIKALLPPSFNLLLTFFNLLILIHLGHENNKDYKNIFALNQKTFIIY